MSDLRAAAQQALEALETRGEHHPRVYRAIEALRAALAETQQEPVAWKVIRSDGGDAFLTGEREIAEATAHNNWTKVPLYASSPRRQWHGLTDDEIEAAWKSCAPKRLLPSFAAAIEAALKEKNA